MLYDGEKVSVSTFSWKMDVEELNKTIEKAINDAHEPKHAVGIFQDANNTIIVWEAVKQI